MKGLNVSRLGIALIATVLIMITTIVAVAAQAQGKTAQPMHLGVSNPAGIAMDNRCTIYTADAKTGHVFCIPADSDPILLARVPGTPTAVTVDKLRNVFVGTEEGVIFLVSLDGTVAKAYQCESSPMGLEIDRDGKLIIATVTGEIVKVRRTDFIGAQ